MLAVKIALVGGENHQGVVGQPQFIQSVQHPSDAVVHQGILGRHIGHGLGIVVHLQGLQQFALDKGVFVVRVHELVNLVLVESHPRERIKPLPHILRVKAVTSRPQIGGWIQIRTVIVQLQVKRLPAVYRRQIFDRLVGEEIHQVLSTHRILPAILDNRVVPEIDRMAVSKGHPVLESQ